MILLKALPLLVMVIFTSCGSDYSSSQGSDSELKAAISQQAGGNTGKKCKVVSGPNKGKTGTYDEDGWCMGDWGGTECKDNQGGDNGKCKDALKITTLRPIYMQHVMQLAR